MNPSTTDVKNPKSDEQKHPSNLVILKKEYAPTN